MQEQILAFWAINRQLQFTQARQDIDCFKRSGMDGVVFQPRHYPGEPDYMTPDYFEQLNQIISYCREQKMVFWLYDENGWPSGSGDGQVMEAMPTLCQEWIEACSAEPDQPIRSVSAVALRAGKIKLKHCAVPGPSAISSQAVQTFRDLIYEGYRQGLSIEAFAYITGFFSDETALPLNKQAPSVPWSDELVAAYNQRTKRRLLKDLPALFADGYFDVERTAEIRIAYWETAASCLGRIYYQTLSQWCVTHHKRFTAHVRGEENLALTVPFSGALCQVLKYVDVPMVDALERHRQNPLFPRVASTLGHVFGDGNAFCEAMGGAGWGIAPQDIVQTYQWLAQSGVNITCLHQSQSLLNAQAIRDWPPSMPKHLTWRPLFSATLQAARQAYHKPIEAPVLAVLPVRAVMASYQAWELQQTNRHKGAVQPDTAATMLSHEVNVWLTELTKRYTNVHVLDEQTVEADGKMTISGLQVGAQFYSAIVAHSACRFNNLQLKQLISQCPPPKVQTTATAVPGTIAVEVNCEQSQWTCTDWGNNQLPIGEHRFIDGHLRLDVDIQVQGALCLKSSDRVAHVTINGQPLANGVEVKDNWYYAIRPTLIRSGMNRIEVVATVAEAQPMLWLQGNFAVAILAQHRVGRVDVADVWQLVPSMEVKDYRHLATAGYPFLGHAIMLHKSLTIPRTLKNWRIEFADFQATGALVTLDQQAPVAYWSHQQGGEAPFPLTKGCHELRVELFPSTFLTYGPFRYIGGDAAVISPLQYAGRKNLMDPVTYPDLIEHQGLNYLDTGIGAAVVMAVGE